MTESSPAIKRQPEPTFAPPRPEAPPPKSAASTRRPCGAGSNYLDISELRASIDALLISFPELAQDEVLRADTFEGMTNLHDVLASLLEKAQDARSMAGAIKGRVEDLSARKARFERQEEAMRGLIQTIMERANLSKVALAEATLSMSMRAPAPVVTNEDALPDSLCRFKRVPDAAAIKAAVAEGGPMPPGVSMSNGRQVLTVRSR